MKILIVGASGGIGGEALRQCLAHPSVSRVVAFLRRELPEEVAQHSKLESVMVNDFSTWPDELLKPHIDAAAVIWYGYVNSQHPQLTLSYFFPARTMGTYDGSVAVDLEYPLAFQEAFGRLLEAQEAGNSTSRFRYIHMSGKLSIQDQDARLWFLERVRKIKVWHPQHGFATN